MSDTKPDKFYERADDLFEGRPLVKPYTRQGPSVEEVAAFGRQCAAEAMQATASRFWAIGRGREPLDGRIMSEAEMIEREAAGLRGAK